MLNNKEEQERKIGERGSLTSNTPFFLRKEETPVKEPVLKAGPAREKPKFCEDKRSVHWKIEDDVRKINLQEMKN